MFRLVNFRLGHFCLFLGACLLVLVAWLDSSSAAAQPTADSSSIPVVVAIDREFRPFEYTDASGRASGFTPELLRMIGTLTGLEFEFRGMNWPEALAALESGEVDIVNMINTPDRQERYLFSHPHSQIFQAIFCRRNGPFINSLEGLTGHMVALQQGDISLENLANRDDFKKTIVPSKEDGFLLLNGGQVDAFLAAGYPGNEIVLDYKLNNVFVGAVDIFPQDFSFAADKANQELINRLNAGLDQLKASGRYHELMRRWFSSRPEPTHWVVRYQKQLLWAVSLALGVLLFLSLWNRVLLRKVNSRTAELKESESLYRTLVEGIHFGIALIDQDRRIVMANPALGEMFGKKDQDLSGLPCHSILNNGKGPCPNCPAGECLTSGEAAESVTTGIREDGTVFAARLRTFPLAFSEKYPGGLIQVVEDISLQIETEASLAAEKERLAVTLRSIGDGVICTDTDGTLILINRVAEELTGWSEAEAIGRPLDEVFHIIDEKTRLAGENPVKKALESGMIVGLSDNATLITRDGRELSIADSGAPIRDRDSRIIGVVLVFRDVTEQKRTESELLKARKLESIGVLAGGIAHDFNNILSAILGNIDMSLLSTNLDPETRDHLVQAEKASLRAKGLTQQLLTFARGGEPVKETALLQDVIQESADFVLHGSQVGCQYQFPTDLWPVEVDIGQFSQVIQNIVINARQAMPNGGTVTIRGENLSAGSDRPPILGEGHFTKVVISDTGIGMQGNVIDKIFDPYFTTKQEGQGLGLALSHSIITRHGGHILVTSQPDKGTSFAIYLPTTPDAQVVIPEERTVLAKAKHAKVLIMDDEEIVRNMIQSMLKRLGYESIGSKDGEEAIRLYREADQKGRPLDLVIMDLTVSGGMGGQEAVQKILAFDPKAKVICSSGYSSDPVLARFQDFGFEGALAKPYKMKDLQDVILRVLGDGISDADRRGG